MAGGGTGGHVIPGDRGGARSLPDGVSGFVCRNGARRGEPAGAGGGVPAGEDPRGRDQESRDRDARCRACGGWSRETAGQIARFGEWKPAAVFSMGGYVAGPPVLAALLRGVPVVVMEPNAVPGFTNRQIARWVKRALISFEETARFFPQGRTELTGLAGARGVFRSCRRRAEGEFTVLITGGSQGSRTLNEAARQSWPLFREAGLPVRFIHQTGSPMYDAIAAGFRETGLAGEVAPFIADMPGAFAQADLVVCRSGAGAVSELAAAGKPSMLIPFPFAADQHQLKNAEAFERAGAARMSLDRDWNGQRFFETVRELYENRARLEAMGECARKLRASGRGAARGGNFSAKLRIRPLTDCCTSRNNKILKCFFHGSISTSRESAESG